MKFTDEELYEIEKKFDIEAGRVGPYIAQLLPILEKYKKGKILINKLLDASVECFDVYRTISVKAKAMGWKRGIENI